MIIAIAIQDGVIGAEIDIKVLHIHDVSKLIRRVESMNIIRSFGNDSNLLIVFYVQIMPDDFVMQLHRF